MEFLVLRWAHLVFGSLWAGGGIAMGFFIAPSIGEAGPGARPVMAGILARRFPQLMLASGVITVLAGLRMYMLVYSAAWLATAQGIVLTIGALAGIVALVVGTLVQGRNAGKLGALAAAIGQGPPTPEQQAEMNALQARMKTTGIVLAWLFLVAVVTMAGARTFA